MLSFVSNFRKLRDLRTKNDFLRIFTGFEYYTERTCFKLLTYKSFQPKQVFVKRRKAMNSHFWFNICCEILAKKLHMNLIKMNETSLENN